jgi:hypothetical protein
MPMNAEYCHGCGNQGEDPEQCERCMDGDLNGSDRNFAMTVLDLTRMDFVMKTSGCAWKLKKSDS